MVTAATFTFYEATHRYRDEHGVPLPSVTQILKAEGFISFDGIPRQILERKRQLGSLVHKVTALWDSGENLEEFEIPDEVWPYVDGYMNFQNDCRFQAELVEHRALGNIFGMRYGMTLDRVGCIDGARHMIELKCGASEHPAWGVQCAAYDIGMNGKETLMRAAVQLGPQFARGYKVRPYGESTDYQIWQSALANTLWKQNKGILQLEDVPERLEIAA